jgi:hypothetical protein
VLGLGATEAGIILVLVLLLFAPTLVAFWLGYIMGQRKAAPGETASARPGPALDDAAAAAPADGSDAEPTGGDEATDA